VLLAWPHRFELVGGDRPYLVDVNGVTWFVRNMMGRHPESDLAVDANFGDVSRAHLVLEWDGAQQFRFMDLSSRGTWLPESLLADVGVAARSEDLLDTMLGLSTVHAVAASRYRYLPISPRWHRVGVTAMADSLSQLQQCCRSWADGGLCSTRLFTTKFRSPRLTHTRSQGLTGR